MTVELTKLAVEAIKRAERVVHTKPFNLEHARAGAPFCCRDGKEAAILKWDGRQTDYPLVGTWGSDMPQLWTTEGWFDHNGKEHHTDLVMTPLGYVDGKPVFFGDELVTPAGALITVGLEHICATQGERIILLDCRWPAPAKVYPETRMTDGDLIYTAACDVDTGVLRDIANAALRHAIDAGQVVSIEDHATELTRAAMSGQDLANDQMRADYQQQSMELGKAERLLESMGFRSVGNGDWQRGPSPVKCFYGHPKKGLYVEGDKASIDKVTAIVARDEARDMAVAEAVNNAWTTVCLRNVPSANIIQLARAVDLAAVIAGVKP